MRLSEYEALLFIFCYLPCCVAYTYAGSGHIFDRLIWKITLVNIEKLVQSFRICIIRLIGFLSSKRYIFII